MIPKHLLLCAVAAAFLALPIAPNSRMPLGASTVEAQETRVSVSFFYDALADEGDWIRYQPYGYVWVPTDVPSDWTPYTRGRWAYTDQYGWTFVSDEPFAWAVYHYGRWGYDEDIGWFWVPGEVWAPAWVTWRRSNDVIGWAPLPPQGEGYAVSLEVDYSEPPREYWHYCETREFLAPDLAVVIIRDNAFYEETEYLGPVVVHNNIVVNNIIEVHSIEQAVRQPVPMTRVEVVSDPREAEQVRRDDQIVAFQGKLAPPTKKAAPSRVVDATAVKPPTKGQKILSAGEQGKDRQAKPNGRVENQAETATPHPEPGIEPGAKKLKRPDKLQGNVAEQPEVAPPKPAKTTKGAQSRASAAEVEQPRRKVKSDKTRSGITSPAGKTAAAAPSTKPAQKKLKKSGSANQAAQRQATAAKGAKTGPAPKPPTAASSGPRKPKKVGLPPSPEKTAAIPKPKAAKAAPARPAKPATVQKRPGKPNACNAKQHATGKC